MDNLTYHKLSLANIPIRTDKLIGILALSGTAITIVIMRYGKIRRENSRWHDHLSTYSDSIFPVFC